MIPPKLMFRARRRPHYMAGVLEASAGQPLEPGRVYNVEVRHADWCSMLAGRGPCDCDPTATSVGREG